MGTIISFISDPFFFLIVGAFMLVLYYNLPDDVKRPIKTIFAGWGVYIILIVAWLYFRNKWGFVYEIPTRWPGSMRQATFIFAFIGGLYLAAGWLLYEQRYLSDTFECNGAKGSCTRRHDIGEWTVFFIGTSGSSDERMVLPWWIPQKIVVVPKNSWDFNGTNMHSITQVFKTPLAELPDDVRHFVETDTFARWGKNNIFFGYISEELRTNDPKMEDLESEIKKLNARITKQSKMLDGNITEMKGFVSDTLAMTDKIRGKQSRRSPEPMGGGE